jgi:hypothetical protein
MGAAGSFFAVFNTHSNKSVLFVSITFINIDFILILNGATDLVPEQ